jgi:hypothetical protein
MSDHDIGELARARGPKALDTLEEIMEDPIAEDRDRVRAAEALLDRGYGKAAQAIIAVPASRRQAALLASMSDEALVAVIEKKELPRIGAPQPMVTIGARPRGFATVVMDSHGPAEEAYAIDPLLE